MPQRMMDGLDRARRSCLALPEAVEKVAWGEPTWRVGKRLFAMFASATSHHGAGRAALWCNAPVGVQEHLVETDPARYFVPPYVGVKGWIGIDLGKVSDAELDQLVRQSYAMVAPKRLLAAVEDGVSGRDGPDPSASSS